MKNRNELLQVEAKKRPPTGRFQSFESNAIR